jgi:hypothetical protein
MQHAALGVVQSREQASRDGQRRFCALRGLAHYGHHLAPEDAHFVLGWQCAQ